MTTIFYCRNCRYQLRIARAGRCPECGRAYDLTDPRTVSRHPNRRHDAVRDAGELLVGVIGGPIAGVLACLTIGTLVSLTTDAPRVWSFGIGLGLVVAIGAAIGGIGWARSLALGLMALTLAPMFSIGQYEVAGRFAFFEFLALLLLCPVWGMAAMIRSRRLRRFAIICVIVQFVLYAPRVVASVVNSYPLVLDGREVLAFIEGETRRQGTFPADLRGYDWGDSRLKGRVRYTVVPAASSFTTRSYFMVEFPVAGGTMLYRGYDETWDYRQRLNPFD